MKIEIVAYGIAREILQFHEQEIQWEGNPKIGAIRNYLTRQYPELSELSSLSFAVNTEYQDDNYELIDGDSLVLIPPVSGG